MRLTRGEAWWLMRRRMGYTCAQMASKMAVSEDRLRAWEYDRVAAPLPSMCGIMRDPVTEGECVAIARRRNGWTLPEGARRLGISRQTLWKAEWGRTAGVASVRRFYDRIGWPRPTTAAPVRVPGGP